MNYSNVLSLCCFVYTRLYGDRDPFEKTNVKQTESVSSASKQNEGIELNKIYIKNSLFPSFNLTIFIIDI